MKPRDRLNKRIRTGKYDTKEKLVRARNAIFRTELKENETLAEKIVREFFEESKIRFMAQKGFIKPFHRIVDFYIPKKKIIIEIDGEYHNNTKYFDYQKDVTWGFMGYKTIRITNAQVLNGDYIKMLDFLS